jgi:protein-tyrosine phosphatase
VPKLKLKILVVCTGNICRSPSAEMILRDRLRAEIRVESAGTSARVGEGIDPQTLQELEAQGVTTRDFSARQLSAAMVDRADLILTMTREHRSAVLRLEPRALRRTFTLTEAAALVDHTEDAGSPEALAAYRPLINLAAADYDIADPYHRSSAAHKNALASITRALDVLVPRLDQPGFDSDPR